MWDYDELAIRTWVRKRHRLALQDFLPEIVLIDNLTIAVVFTKRLSWIRTPYLGF